MLNQVLSSKKNIFKAWCLAIRLRTLPVSVVPILVGSVFASKQVNLNWIIILASLVCSLCIQIGTNFINDAFDFKKGADGIDRLGPLRVTQGGLLSFNQVHFAGCFCFILAMLTGIPLMLHGGLPLILLFLLAIVSGYCYTGGPYPIAYLGYSDFLVLIFFGWASTCMTFYLQTGEWQFDCFLAATQIGLLATVPHAINNFRDQSSDKRAGKKTMAVRFGTKFARMEITCLSYAPLLLGLFWLATDRAWMFLLPLISLYSMTKNLQLIWKHEPSPLFNHCLAKSALCQLEFGFFLSIGMLIA
jgi:1,4-dihydroxy-2-naphthoate polyprenyltransferase